MRLLYLLALAQLVGGPLVLLQLTVLCKLTLHETPRLGLARATMCAWQSDTFQTVLAAGVSTKAGEAKTVPQPRDPKPDPEKATSSNRRTAAGFSAVRHAGNGTTAPGTT